ncbi:MAG: 4'-phosphopantetheinyl transferase superfamily protein [Bacteroidota bacterium]
MIGNDIVDLSFAEMSSNWKRPRFLEKIFTENERQIIFSSPDKHKIVWRLWSMKEAAYKAYRRDEANPFFNPKKLSCSLISESIGTVNVLGNHYETITEMTNEFVHSLAYQKAKKIHLKREIFELKSKQHQHQSDEVREKLRSTIWSTFTDNIRPEKLVINKAINGMPYLVLDKEKLDSIVSLSHHGRFGAYAIC